MTALIHVWTATSTEQEALALAASVTAGRYVAGSQVTHVATTFWHNGECGQGEEWQVRLVTVAELFDPLATFIRERHQWPNPEIVATPIAHASADYAAWVTGIVDTRSPGEATSAGPVVTKMPSP